MSRRAWWAAAAAGLAGVYAWSRVRPDARGEPRDEPVQGETRDKLPVRTLLAGAVLLAVSCAGWFGYQAWLETQENIEVARAITGGDPARAETYLTRYGCAGCHTIPGIAGADGQVAPALAGLRKRVYVGGVLRNTPDNLIAWIADPPAFSPNTAMPVTGISAAEARDVVAYLYAN